MPYTNITHSITSMRKTLKSEWHSYLCKDLDYCYDFMENLVEYENLIDSGSDGTHYGPITNKIIADIILRKVLENR